MKTLPNQFPTPSLTLPNLTDTIRQIATPPQQQFCTLYPRTNAYFRQLFCQCLTEPNSAATLLHTLPEIVGVKKSAIVLAPAVTDQRLLDLVREVCLQRVELYRHGQYLTSSPALYRNAATPCLQPGPTIWTGFTIRTTQNVTRVFLARSSNHEGFCHHGKIYQLPTIEAERLHNIVINDCVDDLQCVLDELRNFIQSALISAHQTKLLPAQLPRIDSIDYDGFLIHSDSPIPNHRIMYAGIAEVLNRAKKVYWRGDPNGRAAYRHKRSRGLPVANDQFRIKITYTVVAHPDHVKVSFLYDLAQKPFFIIPCSHNRPRDMTPDEVKQCRRNFAQLCADALQIYFRNIFDETLLTGELPNYWRPWGETDDVEPDHDLAAGAATNLVTDGSQPTSVPPHPGPWHDSLCDEINQPLLGAVPRLFHPHDSLPTAHHYPTD